MEKRNLEIGKIVIFLLMIGAGGRIVLNSYPNIETVMVSVFLAAILLPRHLSIITSLAIIVLSDWYLGYLPDSGNILASIIVFTYSGFLLVNIFGTKIQNWISGKFGSGTVLKFSGAGISFALIYDIWTNFGVWFLNYEHTLENMITVYMLGIPFMLYHMMSSVATFTMIGIPVYYGLSQTVGEEIVVERKEISKRV
ncbi:MAG: hypothetical protein BEU04_03445 [Marine Group III euryarchaeote CG-Bathy1]|uniref:Rod shape-determining protein MreD n=1 Tax=Marine Group III euryarchaeote CG-Bathy1 TaxID=1889001 RepID=A0A1J5SZN1_9ARCH|nr:MAG: hypothetical protein BEU04_03445 [Marine Group III euryarchaeote CG-Bathy1]